MGNWDLDIGREYLQRTIYDARELFAVVLHEPPAPNEPLHYKIYRDVPHHRLPQHLPLSLGDARSSFDELSGRPPGGSAPKLDPDQLSTLLYYTYGLSRRDEGPGAVWPFHRQVPSARCLFPTELYMWLPQTGEIAAGIYHYDPLHHRLALLRSGDYLEALAAILGTEQDGAQCVLLVSSLFWKTAHKYRDYAYRLCTQEAGMVLGNLLIVSGTLGYRGRVHYQFLDEIGAKLLGFDTSEEQILGAVALFSADDEVRLRRRKEASTGRGSHPDIPPVALEHARADRSGHELGALFKGIVDNSLLHSVKEFAREPQKGDSGTQLQEAERIMPPTAPAECCLDLARALRTRNSGNVLFNPVSDPLSSEAFWEIVRYALSPYACDLRECGSEISLSLYAAVFDVDGIQAGVYRIRPGHGGLQLVNRGDLSRPLQGAMAVPNINLCASNMVLYITGSYPAASLTFGNRAYRILNMEAGLIAQRICVMSAAFERSARIHNGYDAYTVEEVLRIADRDQTPLFQIAVGSNRPGLQYSLPIVF